MNKQTWQQWARIVARDVVSPSQLTRDALASLTGQDTRAAALFVAALELYAVSDDDGQRAGLGAMNCAVRAMQEKTRWIARELIPYVLEWEDRDRLWPRIWQG